MKSHVLQKELESGLPIDMCFEEDESDASSSYSDPNDEPTHDPYGEV
jgi:hypothetical protein